MQIRLDAPKPGWFFSTDFPLVEGSRLLDMKLPIRGGKIQWQYLFPIRGEYQVDIEAVTVDDEKADKIFHVTIRENERKWVFLGFFTLGLFLLGFLAGRLFTPTKPGLKGNAALWILLSFLGLISWNGRVFAQKVETEKYAGRLEVDVATVGKLSRIRWSLVGLGEGEERTANLSLRIAHLERGKVVFAVEKVPVVEVFSMDFQFTDGDEYRVEAIADVNGRESIRTEQTISVTGIEPPASAAVPAMVFFLMTISLGLWAGRWSRRVTAPS